MNYTDLKKDFQTRYHTKNTPSVLFAGKRLALLGEWSDSTLYSTLSAGTALAFNLSSNPGQFTVQNTDSNIAYVCDKKELKLYCEDNFARDIFKKLEEIHTQTNISGLDMLFKNSTKNPDFFNYNDALTMAFSPHTSQKSPQYPSFVYSRNTNSYQKIPLSFSDKKIIIITDKIKKQHIGKIHENAITKTHDSNQITDELLSNEALSQHEQAVLRFILNEEKRVKTLATLSNFENICQMINSSGDELFSLSTSDKILTLQDILSSSASALAFRPTLDLSAVYVICMDFAVDSLIKHIEKEYEKKVGSKPTFYICNVVSNHLIH